MFLKGTVVYNPERKGLKDSQNRNVIILDLSCYEDLAAYYREIFYHKFHIKLLEPLFPLHLTILKNKDINEKEWNYKDKQEVEIEIQDAPLLYWNDKYVWIDGETEIMKEISEYYGVSKKYNMGHITIGRFKDHERGMLGESKR